MVSVVEFGIVGLPVTVDESRFCGGADGPGNDIPLWVAEGVDPAEGADLLRALFRSVELVSPSDLTFWVA